MDEDGGARRERETSAGRTGSLRDQVTALVLERGYTRHDEPFQLSSGGTSRDYVDLRRAVASGDALRLVGEAVLEHLVGLGVGFDAIGGMTMGADPVAHAVALLGEKSWFSVRKAEKTHGSRRRIEGAPVGPGLRVVLFEDTVSTGGSVLEAYEVVASTGAEVVLCCTVLDRGDAAGAQFEKRSVPYSALLTYRDLGIDPLAPAVSSRGAPT